LAPTLTTAQSLSGEAMRELFNQGFSDYLVPMHLDAAAFTRHLDINDIDLSISPVLVDEQPLSFALVGVRDDEAWIGGMGTVPAGRRHGYGQLVMESALAGARAGGCSLVWLEVIDANRAALGLYEKLGFEVARDLLVWTLAPSDETGDAVEVDVHRASSCIALSRQRPQPWQHADAVLAKLAQADDPLRAVGVEHDGELVGAAICTVVRGTVGVMQIAAADETVATNLLRSAAAGRPLRLSNVPSDEAPSRAMGQLGAELVARQYEMRRAL
jgi:GNAT superfamily N-acetyltransferase